MKLTPEVLEGLVSTSKWPRNEAKFLASSRPRPRKTRIKSLVLKMAEEKAEIPRNSSSRPRKGRGKGKNSSPRLVLDLGKILLKVSSSTSSSPDDPSRTSGAALVVDLFQFSLLSKVHQSFEKWSPNGRHLGGHVPCFRHGIKSVFCHGNVF